MNHLLERMHAVSVRPAAMTEMGDLQSGSMQIAGILHGETFGLALPPQEGLPVVFDSPARFSYDSLP